MSNLTKLNPMYNKIKNKKAASQIVTAVFLIMISVTAVAIIFTSIRTVISNPNLSPENSCLNLQLKSLITIEKACYNQQTKDIEITVTRNIDDKITLNTLGFIINTQPNSKKFSCNYQCGNCDILSPGQTKTYYFQSNEVPSTIKVLSSNCLLSESEVKNC